MAGFTFGLNVYISACINMCDLFKHFNQIPNVEVLINSMVSLEVD